MGEEAPNVIISGVEDFTHAILSPTGSRILYQAEAKHQSMDSSSARLMSVLADGGSASTPPAEPYSYQCGTSPRIIFSRSPWQANSVFQARSGTRPKIGNRQHHRRSSLTRNGPRLFLDEPVPQDFAIIRVGNVKARIWRGNHARIDNGDPTVPQNSAAR
jgi:hypothetical protein